MNRRLFLATTLSGFALSSFKSKRQLCFSTLGCPEWSWDKILRAADKYGFEGIEIRGLLDEIDILKSPTFSKENLKVSKRMAEDYGVEIVNINPSANLHETNIEKRKENIDTVKRYIELANEIYCPFVRVFPDKLAFKEDKKRSLDLIGEGLEELSSFSKGTGVKTLLDAHGDVVFSSDIEYIMKSQDLETTGIIWDYFNMHLKTGEKASEMVGKLSEYINFVQIKDGYLKEGVHEYTLPGRGEVPILDILKAVDSMNYKGFISLEWEKRWHPELEGLERALPLFKKIMKK
ncbi:MAG: sugar phosphate isomerase/epimerase [Arcticibacterium sp.]|jgi:sugar phosphate isomerase/epimerase